MGFLKRACFYDAVGSSCFDDGATTSLAPFWEFLQNIGPSTEHLLLDGDCAGGVCVVDPLGSGKRAVDLFSQGSPLKTLAISLQGAKAHELESWLALATQTVWIIDLQLNRVTRDGPRTGGDLVPAEWAGVLNTIRTGTSLVFGGRNVVLPPELFFTLLGWAAHRKTAEGETSNAQLLYTDLERVADSYQETVVRRGRGAGMQQLGVAVTAFSEYVGWQWDGINSLCGL